MYQTPDVSSISVCCSATISGASMGQILAALEHSSQIICSYIYQSIRLSHTSPLTRLHQFLSVLTKQASVINKQEIKVNVCAYHRKCNQIMSRFSELQTQQMVDKVTKMLKLGEHGVYAD